ncbi:hypothetical protein F4677DRAFT_436735 [Hypoxylon crocopeplum]|nr:hypothetical protein F4677DRAFT_436735 [Hypoxylon crocopeplum]
MDWPRAEDSFNDHDFKAFTYATRPFKIIKKLLSDEDQDPVCWNIESPRDLRKWIQEHGLRIHDDCKDGTLAIIFDRASEAHSRPSYLPVSICDFGQIIELFHINPTIVRTICRKGAHFSRTYLGKGCSGENRIVYTARMSSAWDDDIAMSSTYVRRKRLNLAVFYGCNEEQSSDIESRLAKAGSAICHPLLTPGILVELDRSRLSERVESTFDNFVLCKEALCCTSRDPTTIMNQDGESTDEISRLFDLSREYVKGIRAMKQQIDRMLQYTTEIENMTVNSLIKRRRACVNRNKPNMARMRTPDYSNIDLQIRERLLEIGEEYDQKLDQCHMVLDGLSFAAHMASDHVARNQVFTNTEITIETRRDNAQMRSIALMTMIYLPLSSVASVFSMGVFNWGANAGQPVLTMYFWVYIGVAGALTILTVGIWLALTQARRQGRNDVIDLEA